jgi:hypothetical protein
MDGTDSGGGIQERLLTSVWDPNLPLTCGRKCILQVGIQNTRAGLMLMFTRFQLFCRIPCSSHVEGSLNIF